MTVKQFSPDIAKLEKYCKGNVGGGGEFSVKTLEPMFGGSSRFSYRFDYSCVQDGKRVDASAILRCIPPDGGVSPADARKEYKVISAVYNKGYLVPKPIAYCSDTEVLGCEFLVMEEIKGCDATLESLSREPYLSKRKSIGKDCWTLLGQLATYDPVELGLVPADKAQQYASGWPKMLDIQEKLFRATAVYVDPITEALFGWLRNNPPPPSQKPSVVHGDFRSGNFLYDASGRIRSILDWELWFVGDPLFDLAYTLMPLWADEEGLAGRLLDRGEAIELWEKASGLKADPEALRWWEVFCCQRFLSTNHNVYRRFLSGSEIDTQFPLLMLGWGPQIESYAIELITGNKPTVKALHVKKSINMSGADFLQTIAKVIEGPLKQQVADNPWWSMQCDKLALITRYSADDSKTSLEYKAHELLKIQEICKQTLKVLGDKHCLSSELQSVACRSYDISLLIRLDAELESCRNLMIKLHNSVYECDDDLSSIDHQLWTLYSQTTTQKLSFSPSAS